ncbi:hypothetical protein FSP39_004865 [Pinctada imbricata]|uniref:DUF5077 domain-containing protein n=1 Tax=Pinctada imbricata TaxID=66713 RepID=A0AA89C4N9_PINIB|nr:hypothetical protein FSP39_004865 [Pinctada imbricata]
MDRRVDQCYPDAARSVHLWWRLPREVSSVTNEVCVTKSCPGTYFCIIGFNGGYSGIQELCDGSRKLIFSVWDNEKDEDPVEERRVKVLYHGEGVEVSRFGNEGTGGKTMMPYAWKDNEPVKFKVTAESDSSKEWTAYSCYVYNNQDQTWFHIATLKTLSQGKLIRGVYSFVEDFRRDKKSFHEHRRALFGDCCTMDQTGCPKNCEKVQFTADNTPADNINAGYCNVYGKYFLETGADTVNTHAKLNDTISKTFK